MKQEMPRLNRIRDMGERFDRLSAFTADLRKLQNAAVAADEDEACLKDYLESGMWLEDYEQDEQGLLPGDLKRGVLSEDGLYDLLTELQELRALLSGDRK